MWSFLFTKKSKDNSEINLSFKKSNIFLSHALKYIILNYKSIIFLMTQDHKHKMSI